MPRVISRALEVALQRGRVTRNVATLVDAPSAPKTEIEPLTAADARAILATARGQRNAARWSVALALGLRQGEALGLAWKDLDLTTGTIRVTQALQRTTGGLVLVPPKSAAGRRTLVVPPPLLAELALVRQQQEQERVTAGQLTEVMPELRRV